MSTDPAYEDLGLAGYQPVEFLDIPSMSESRGIFPDLNRAPRFAARLDGHTRLTITRWAREYISSLVDRYNGAEDDIRFVIEGLMAAEDSA